MMGNFTTFLEEKLMPIATKFSTQRHLKAIRDAFICIMPYIGRWYCIGY